MLRRSTTSGLAMVAARSFQLSFWNSFHSVRMMQASASLRAASALAAKLIALPRTARAFSDAIGSYAVTIAPSHVPGGPSAVFGLCNRGGVSWGTAPPAISRPRLQEHVADALVQADAER